MSEIIQTGADGMDGRIDRLSIKADRSGIAVYIPECMSVQDICSELYKKILRNIRAFDMWRLKVRPYHMTKLKKYYNF